MLLTASNQRRSVRAAPDAPVRIALAGGGTGGHLVPGLHLMDAWREAGLAVGDWLWLHGARPIEGRVLHDVEARAGGVSCVRKVLALEGRSGGAPHPLMTCLRTPRALLGARQALLEHQSEIVLGLGGFVSVPALLAGRSLGLPLAMLEINAVPGRATRVLGRICERVYHAWQGGLASRSNSRERYVGPPLPPSWCSSGDARARSLAREALGFAPDKALLVVLGGSQGAGALNHFVRSALPTWIGGGLSVLHQIGPGRLAEAAPATEGYRAAEYLEPMSAILSAAELVLSRGGASTLAEIGAAGVPVVVVPYPHHKDHHQERNARELGAGARIVPERDLTPEFARQLAELAGPTGRSERELMRAAVRASMPRDGALRIYADLLELVERAHSRAPSPSRPQSTP